MSDAQNKPRLWLRMAVLVFIRIALLLGPTLAVMIANRARYFSVLDGALQIGFGGMIGIVFGVQLIVGVFKPTGAIYMFGAMFLLSWLFSALSRDLFLLSAIAFVCSIVDIMVMSPLCNAMRQRIFSQRTAETTAAEVKKIVEGYIGRV